MKTLPERLWSHVVILDGCWVWIGATSGGYGKIQRGRRGAGFAWAHRVVWELLYGEVPADMRVLHRCDNPPCIRPTHLYLGTQEDNMRDAAARGRTSSGENHPSHRLSAEDVRQVRTRLARGDKQAEIARDFGVSRGTIGDIATNRTWCTSHRAEQRAYLAAQP